MQYSILTTPTTKSTIKRWLHFKIMSYLQVKKKKKIVKTLIKIKINQKDIRFNKRKFSSVVIGNDG